MKSVLLEQKISSETKKMGLCGRCKWLMMRTTRFGNMIVQCERGGDLNVGWKNISRHDEVVDCTEHYPRGQLHIWEMEAIATVIEVRNNPGFSNEVEVIFKKNENNAPGYQYTVGGP